jgi:hypothetical protein
MMDEGGVWARALMSMRSLATAVILFDSFTLIRTSSGARGSKYPCR